MSFSRCCAFKICVLKKSVRVTLQYAKYYVMPVILEITLDCVH